MAKNLKLSFTMTLSDGRQYTLHRPAVIPADAVELIAGRDYAVYGTESQLLLACYSYAEQPTLEFSIQCSSVEEAQELVRILRDNN